MPTFQQWRRRDRLISTRARAIRSSSFTALPPRKEVNWVSPGWVSTLTRAGPPRDRARQSRARPIVQALRSGRLSHRARWREDVRALLDHLSIERADVMGYSMGARITAFLALQASGSRALGHSRRTRLQAGGRRRGCRKISPTRWKRRRSTTSPIRGADVPRLRRSDQIRPPRARGLHPRHAPDDDARARSRRSRCRC